MKKAFALGLSVMAVFALTGCDMINSILQGGKEAIVDEKKQYYYEDFVVEIAAKDFQFDFTKCKAEIDNDGEKSEINYTYDAENNKWTYETVKEENGEEVTKTKSTNLDVINYTKDSKTSAALMDKKPDAIFKYYTVKNGYIITGSYKDDLQKLDLEYNFNEYGLLTSAKEDKTDLNKIENHVKQITYTYSK